MEKNILLLFLSPAQTILNDNGAVAINKRKYANIDGDEETLMTNESAVRWLLKENIALDKIFILASKKVREEIDNRGMKFLDADNKPQTHLQLFLERVKKFSPNTECEVYDYDEDAVGDEKLKSIADMAGRIQKYAAGEQIALHVDLTGGMRDVNIMMLELTRLLEYSGLKTDRLLYSNLGKGKVELLKNIYDLFQLIAGVEEFVNFGSVHALEKYYADKDKSPALKKLLDAMKNFAEAIKLCHYGQFRNAIIILHDAVRDFEPEPDNPQDILMARFIERIREDYNDLIAIRDKDDLRVIRWCLKHDYMQQALTLYTERVPEYLGENGILTQTTEEAKDLAENLNKDTMHRNRWFYLFSAVEPSADKLSDGKKIFCRAINRDAVKAFQAKNFDFDVWFKDLNEKLVEYNLSCAESAELRVQLETLAAVFKDYKLLIDLSAPQLEPIRKILNDLSPKLEALQKGFERKKILVQFMNNGLSEANVPRYFRVADFMSNLKKYPNAIKIYELLIEKIFSVSVAPEKFLSIADDYYRVKTERNHSNHAHEDSGEFDTKAELYEFMSAGLDKIAKLVEEKNSV